MLIEFRRDILAKQNLNSRELSVSALILLIGLMVSGCGKDSSEKVEPQSVKTVAAAPRSPNTPPASGRTKGFRDSLNESLSPVSSTTSGAKEKADSNESQLAATRAHLSEQTHQQQRAQRERQYMDLATLLLTLDFTMQLANPETEWKDCEKGTLGRNLSRVDEIMKRAEARSTSIK